jgi:hypothetical protein
MNPISHERTLKAFSIAAFLIAFPFIVIGCIGHSEPATLIEIICVWLIGVLAMDAAIIYLIPVTCIHPRCMGRLKPSWYRGNGNKYEIVWRLIYTCDSCGAHHLSGFTVSISLGVPGEFG